MLVEVAMFLPFILWLILRFTLGAGPYNMDPCGKGTFFPHLILYSVFGYAVCGLSLFGAVFGASHHLDWHPAMVLLFGAIYALLFVGVMAFFYEAFMTVSYPNSPPGAVHTAMGGHHIPQAKSNYTIGRYATVLSLGISSVMLLITGAMWTAVELGK